MNSSKNVLTRMLSPKEFALLTNVSQRTFQTWRTAGKLPKPDLHIGKVIRWKQETIEAWIATRCKKYKF